MPITKMPGTKGGFRATYGGKTRNFKTRNAAEKWALNYARRQSGAVISPAEMAQMGIKKPTKRPKVGAAPRRGAGHAVRVGRAGRIISGVVRTHALTAYLFI